jgi:hypothetical protein
MRVSCRYAECHYAECRGAVIFLENLTSLLSCFASETFPEKKCQFYKNKQKSFWRNFKRLFKTQLFSLRDFAVLAGNAILRERLSTDHLLIKAACLVKRINKIFN